MWIIIPLIYLMSWRTCRRFGQALNETAAWIVGYLTVAGVVLLLDYGDIGTFSATPDDPSVTFAIIGGFVGMGISRYRWKRRGGHLQTSTNRFARAMTAMKSGDSSTSATRPVASRPAAPSTPRPTASRPATRPAPRGGAKPGANRWARALNAMLTPDDKRRPKR